MSSKKGSSKYAGFGKTVHYDSKGKKAGYSYDSGFGKTVHYDSKGKKVGHSYDSGFGTKTHYDSRGKQVGKTYNSGMGTSKHYDSKGKQVGYSYDSNYSSSHYSGSGGCYIATCVYGSYDCPEVWTLRRFRDNFLSEFVGGQIFIKTYYAISPLLVKCLGNFKLFRYLWKQILDRLVTVLLTKGYSDLPYEDKKY